MNSNAKPSETAAGKLVDHIARSLPDEDRAEYFRVIRHCRDLPENDEMLRILNILRILTQIMVQVPDKVVTEREGFEQLFRNAVASLTEALRSSRDYQKELDAKISDLPKSILKGLNPSSFASKINECLQQQFTTLELPQTSRALSTTARDMKRTAAEFDTAADALLRGYRGATASTVGSIAEMKSEISSAAQKLTACAAELTRAVETKQWQTTGIIAVLTLLLGLVMGLYAGSRM